MRFDVIAHSGTVDRINERNGIYHFLPIANEEAALAGHDQFGSGSPRKRDDRAAHSHRLDHHNTEGLFPLDGVQESLRTTQQVNFLVMIHRADILYLLPIKM